MATKSSFKEILTKPYRGEIPEGHYTCKLNNVVFAYNKDHRTPAEKAMLRDKFPKKILETADTYLFFTPDEFKQLLTEECFEPNAQGNGADYFTFTWFLPDGRLFTRNLFLKDLIIFMKQTRIQRTGKNTEEIPDPVEYIFSLIGQDLEVYFSYEKLKEQNRRVQNVQYCEPLFAEEQPEDEAKTDEKPF
jgi:hypothetical protein